MLIFHNRYCPPNVIFGDYQNKIKESKKVYKSVKKSKPFGYSNNNVCGVEPKKFCVAKKEKTLQKNKRFLEELGLKIKR